MKPDPPRQQVTDPDNKHSLPDWTEVTEVQIKPLRGSDITKVIFAEFKWTVSRSK